MLEKKIFRCDLTLFGEGVGTTAVSGETSATAAALPSGEEGQDAAAERAKAFEQLIKGEYKDLYDARVQEVVRRRLGAAKEESARYLAVAPTLKMLEELLSVSPSDTDAIGKRIKGLIEGEKTRKEGEKKDAAACEERYHTWRGEAERLRRKFPSFDVKSELGDARFRAMLESGVDMESAFLVLHRDRVIPAALAHTARTVRENVTRAVRDGAMRPAEAGLAALATATVGTDVSRFSRKDREAIIRRVREGEKITL